MSVDSPILLFIVMALSIATALVLQRTRPLVAPKPVVAHRVRRNVAITVIMLAVGGAAGTLMVFPATYAQDHEIGLLRVLGVPALGQAVVGLFALEFVYYWLHRAEHMWTPLWRIHRAHHTDLDMDVLSSIRSNPLDFTLTNAVFGLVVVLPLGLTPTFVVAYNLFAFAMVWLQHARTELPRPISRAVDSFLMSPGNHRMHHSLVRAETDSNYGSNVVVFDRLFRTHSAPRVDVRYGLDRADILERQSVLRMLTEPFRPDIVT